MKKTFYLCTLSVAMSSVLYGCGGSSSSDTSSQALPVPPPAPSVSNTPKADTSGLMPLNLSALPAGWENSNQSLIDSKLAAVGSPTRISANTANNIPIVQQANEQQASLANTKKFADSVNDNLNNIKNVSYATTNKTINFDGHTTSELAKVLANDTKIIVNQPLQVDSIVNINNLKNIDIECKNNVEFKGNNDYEAAPSYRPAFLTNKGVVNKVVTAFNIDNSQNIQLSGCQFNNTQAVIASNSKYLNLESIFVKDSKGYGVILSQNNQNVIINGSNFENNYGSGILVLDNNKHLILSNNNISNGQGFSPWQSGIVITDKKSQKVTGQTDFLFPNNYLMPALNKASTGVTSTDIYLIKNNIQNNKADGVLLDGVKNIYIGNNKINNNNREGLELVNIHSSVINNNEFKTNGWVKDVPEEILTQQFPINFRKEADGGYRLKDSAIALDNAVYNFITNNIVIDNYGSGIHLKRAGFYNFIGQNTIQDNNKAKIDNSVLLNNGININSVPLAASAETVKFAPSMGNIIYKNNIGGSNQNGIELCIYCEDNEVLENTITSPLSYSIKQYIPREQNLFKDNSSNAKSENVDLNANGSGSSKAGSIVTSDWGANWLTDADFKNLIANQNQLQNINNVFIGSSTIRFWDLAKYFSSNSTANRGFGGSQSYDVKVYLKTLLGNSDPKAIFLYVGDNDIASGKLVERTSYHIQQNLAYLQLFRPQAKITYIGIKLSPSRSNLEGQMLQVNELVKNFSNKNNIGYIDTVPLVKNPDGSINQSIYRSDKLHLNDTGYAILSNAVRPNLR